MKKELIKSSQTKSLEAFSLDSNESIKITTIHQAVTSKTPTLNKLTKEGNREKTSYIIMGLLVSLNSKLKLVPGVEVADYTVIIGYEDAGEEVTGSFTVDLERTGNIVPNSFEKGMMTCIDTDGASGGSGANIEQPLARVQINGSPNASENGYYLFAGTPQQPTTIEQQMSNNTDVITINRTDAQTFPGCSPEGSWYFSTVSFADVESKFLSNGCEVSGCDSGTQSISFGGGAVDFSVVEII